MARIRLTASAAAARAAARLTGGDREERLTVILGDLVGEDRIARQAWPDIVDAWHVRRRDHRLPHPARAATAERSRRAMRAWAWVLRPI